MLNNLADLYRKQGQYEQAEPLYLRMLQIQEQVLRPEHPEVARSLNGLIVLYWQQGKQALGPEHPKTNDTRKRVHALF